VRYLLSVASIHTVLPASQLSQIHAALAEKDTSELANLTKNLPKPARESLLALVQLYGDEKVLEEAKKVLQPADVLLETLSNLKWLASQISGTKVTFDLAELSGYAYYSGARFAIYAKNAPDALVRGGRYDEVGAVFGRNRPAVGFSLDIKELVNAVAPRPLKAAIRAPWGESASLRAAIARLRQGGETVVCVLPSHESEVDEFDCDRELVEVTGQWVIQAV
jgi:ATP phosphoribosyltransferase regulatory subunit